MATKHTALDATMAAQDESTEAAEALVNRFSDAELRGADSFDAAVALATATFGGVIDASTEIGSGFVMLTSKDRLVNEPFVILSFSFHEGDYLRGDTGEKGFFVAVMLVTKRNERFVMIDGGAGIYSQLDDFYVRTSRSGGMLVNMGLRKSEYETEIDGRMQPATTYYLNV